MLLIILLRVVLGNFHNYAKRYFAPSNTIFCPSELFKSRAHVQQIVYEILYVVLKFYCIEEQELL